MKRRDNLRVEMKASASLQLRRRHLVGFADSINAVADNRVESICDSEDARVKVNLFGAQS